MDISINRPFTTITLNIADSEPIDLRLYTGTPKVYQAITESWMYLERIQRDREELHTKGLSQMELAHKTCRSLENEAGVSIDAIRLALGEEFQKIESIVGYLPLSSLIDILTAIAKSMGDAMIEDLSKGKI